MRNTASDRLLKRLQDEIDVGTLSAGDRIDEQMLATRFAVSRTPAREALLQLAAAGAVRMVPRQGAVVIGVSPSLAVGMIEVLTALEAEAAGLAARRMRPEPRKRLASLHAEAARSVENLDSDSYIARNADFHSVIHEGAGNQFLAEQIASVRRRMRFYHRSSLTQPARLRASWQEHAQVVAAIAMGDEAKAQAAMRQHILFGGRVFADMLASLAADELAA
jgi:DNA-binding GntR family transcriptional regulator